MRPESGRICCVRQEKDKEKPLISKKQAVLMVETERIELLTSTLPVRIFYKNIEFNSA